VKLGAWRLHFFLVPQWWLARAWNEPAVPSRPKTQFGAMEIEWLGVLVNVRRCYRLHVCGVGLQVSRLVWVRVE